MARKATTRTKKTVKTPTLRRGSNAAKLSEERHVGRETVDWENVTDFELAFRDTLRHYGYFYDIKEGNKWAAEWVKKNYTKAKLADFKAAEPWRTSMTIYSMCKMMLNGATFDEKRMAWLKEGIDNTIAFGNQKRKAAKSDAKTMIQKKSPADIVKERTSDFIAEIEEVLDMFNGKTHVDWAEYSVYNELQRVDAAYNTAKGVVDYYTPQMEEIQELVSKKTDDLVEAYSHMTIKKRKELLSILKSIVSDAEKYMSAKKVTRKPRKKKTVSSAQIVSKVKYLKESAEYKVASVDPSDIIGAKIVWLFNVKYRTFTRLESVSTNGMSIKGTTILNFDEDKSAKKKVRKPEEFLSKTTKTTKTKINKEFVDLKTKESVPNGRINADTIIYKVYK